MSCILKATKNQRQQRQQITKVNDTCNTCSDILYRIPQVGPLLFNIYISDMFYDIDKYDIVSYAYGNIPYTSDFNVEETIQKIELITNNLFEWFKNNHIKANADKCRQLVTRDTDVTAKVGEFDVKNGREEEFIGLKIDVKLSFKYHVS